MHLPFSVIAALHLDHPRPERLQSLDDRQWRDTLAYCDRQRLTLWLRERALPVIPDWVRDRTRQDASKNLRRLAGIEAAYRDLAAWFDAAGIEFLALKGLTHPALFGGSS